MGKCSSKTQSEPIYSGRPISIEPDSNPSEWTQEQVLSWLSTVDLNIKAEDQSKLSKKFKKYKIDGEKLTRLTECKLKTKLKINPIGLRLELMSVINKKKSCQPFPSPLYDHNEYQLPQYYPFDYKYQLNINNNQQHSLKHNEYQKDRLSWTIGTIVSLNVQEYETWCAAQIIQTTNEYDVFQFDIDPKLSDYVTVVYDLGDGQIKRKKINRFDMTSIQSDDRFLRNRWKLQKNCMLEAYNTYTNEWLASYIKTLGSRNKNDFVIENIYKNDNNNNNLRFDRWDPKIRCSEALLTLTTNSELYVFNCSIEDYCCAKIIEIFHDYPNNIYINYQQQKLNIFKVIYKTQDNEYFYKYIHQFSANILQLSTDLNRPSDYTDLEVVMHSNKYQIKHDIIDEKHTQLLLKGWFRREINIKYNRYTVDLVNLLTLLMSQCKYHTCPIYGLIMYLESKYWSALSI